ncbi:hypothetical protein OF83DRAFT_1135307 [Amylostereum chailletii]|nr:hypothetical protein OF83DRAFT_1135307 [Amylostereum chailletii]
MASPAPESRAHAPRPPPHGFNSLILLVPALAFALLVGSIWSHNIDRTTCADPSLLSTQTPLLQIETASRSPPVSYNPSSPDSAHHSSIPGRLTAPHPSQPDTTAVVLNWSRFPNVRRIVALLCSPELSGTIAQIVVWNNNPIPFSYADFALETCPEWKLRIVNSHQNIYFQARFIACSQANSTYCFFQDDDYLVLPEVLHAMHTRIVDKQAPTTIYLLPPHERLSSDLRKVYNPDRGLHASFAWLGHGALLHRSRSTDFLSLMNILNATDEELKMADNYFSLLSNSLPETWFDQGIELGGGQPFTIGLDGEMRNNKHILRAAHFVDSVLLCPDASCPRMVSDVAHPYTLKDAEPRDTISPTHSFGVAPCFGRACVLETTISLLPRSMWHLSQSAGDLLDIERHNAGLLGFKHKKHYTDYPPSHAVDGRPDTVFRSPSNAQAQDSITLDMLQPLGSHWHQVEMVWLVDTHTKALLRNSVFESSSDGKSRVWTVSTNSLICSQVPINIGVFPRFLQECVVGVPESTGARYFRTRLMNDSVEGWSVYEVWMRGINVQK